MKRNRLIILLSIVILAIVIALFWNRDKPIASNENEERIDLKTGQLEPKKVEGGNYPYVKPDFERKLNEKEKPFKVPNGPKRGKMKPNNEVSKIKELKAGNQTSQAPLYFDIIDENGDATPNAHTTNPEPSVAENGQTIMTTGNFWVSLSEDGGANFTTLSPSTIFPNDYGGFCCDQVLQYIPQLDLFVWLLQYGTNAAGVNAIRIAVQNTNGVRSSNGTSWTYWDFTNTFFDPTRSLDYNDMSFGNDFLYWTTSTIGGGRYVIRVPLKELQARSTVNFQFTGSTDAFWSHVTQNGTNGVYWAGHKDNSTLRVFSMMDADGFYSWREVPINSWPNGTMSSIAANGTDWLSDASWKTYVRAAAIRRGKIYFAWNASNGGGFPRTHVQIVELNSSTFALENQMQIWNPDFAFAYPYFETNSEGELGMISAFGGGTFNASSGVGVWGDFVIYYPRLSGMSQSNYGHYHTARRSGSNQNQWVGAGYTNNADGTVLPYYLKFRR